MKNYLNYHGSSSSVGPQTDESRYLKNYGNITTEQIEKKKKIVSDLMALRRMKVQERQDSPFFMNFPKLPMIDSSLQSEHLEPLLQDTVLEKELNSVYGKQALNKATDHFAVMSQFTDDADESAAEIKRGKFIGDITNRRKFKLDRNRQQRMRKQQDLFNKQNDLARKELTLLSSSSVTHTQDSFNDDIPTLVENAEKNLKGMERNLRLLKIKYAKDLSSKFLQKLLKEEIEALKKNYPETVATVVWIIDLILGNVEHQLNVKEGNLLESQLVETLVVADKQQYESLLTQIIKSEATLNEMNAIVEEAVTEMLGEIFQECIFLSRMTIVYPSDMLIHSSTQAAAVAKKEKIKIGNSNLIDEVFVGIRQSRELSKNGVWSHSQTILNESKLPSIKSPRSPLPLDPGGDFVSVSSENARPKLDSNFGNSIHMVRHSANEKTLWKQFNISTADVTIPPKRTIGINVVSLTCDHSYLAVGSYKGDVLVYDGAWSDFTLLRSVVQQGKMKDSIIFLNWSLDNSRLASLSAQGCIVVWSVSFSPFISPYEVSLLNVSSSSYISQQLTALSVLETTKGDFVFQDKIFADVVGYSFPNLVLFHPTVSAAGTQDNIIVAFKNGNILKCNLFNNLQARFTKDIFSGLQSSSKEIPMVVGRSPIKVHKIGQDINVEVFRFHRLEILRICFMLNNGDMISLDTNLNLCQWKHQPEYLTSFGWFTPYKKFRLSFGEEILTFQGKDDIVFEDSVALKKELRGKKRKSKKVIEQERRQALREMEDYDLAGRKPWYTDEFPDKLEENTSKKPLKFITRIYAPAEDFIADASAGGVRFWVVTIKRSSGLLLKLAYRTYESQTNTAVSILNHTVSAVGDRLYFMVLYDEHLPKTRKHVSFVELDLSTMEFGRIGPIQVDISKKVFDQCKNGNVSFFALSRVDGCIGSEYIASNICGQLYVHSLLTGRVIIQKLPDSDDSDKNHELYFPGRVKKLGKDSRLLFINPDGNTNYILTYAIQTKQLPAVAGKVIKIEDQGVERRPIYTTYKYLVISRRKVVADESLDVAWFKPEQAAQRELYTHRHLPLALYMELLINTMIDVVLARTTKVRMPQDMRKKALNQDWLRMENYFSQKF